MYKLLIVDDEKVIREGIANSIPWEDLGFEIAGLCANGLEAVEFIKQDKPHVVLSDIRMPQMDGVELMQLLNKQYPEIKIVILSGYNDFEYLNMSIKNRVTEYLLKPTDVDEFEELFKKMKERLDEEQEKEEEYKVLKQSREKERKYQYIKYFNLLLKGYFDEEEEWVEEESVFGYTKNFHFSKVFVIESSLEEENQKGQLYKIRRKAAALLNDILNEKERGGYFFETLDEKLAGIVSVGEDEAEEDIKLLASQIQKRIEEEGLTYVSVGISGLCTSAEMLPQCYEQAKCCVGQRMFLGKNHILSYSELKQEDFAYYEVHLDFEQILKYIVSNQTEELSKQLKDVFQAFENKMVPDYKYIDRMCMECLFNVSRKTLKYHIRLEQLMNELGTSYNRIYEIRTLEGKREYLYKILSSLACKIEEAKANNKKNNSLANIVREIADKEYMSNLISLEYVGEKVNKNAAYISKIFKHEIGYNFSDYVTKKRLEKSRELLQDQTLKVYEIAAMLGYAEASNFIKVFKKHYGVSPNEYRNTIGRD